MLNSSSLKSDELLVLMCSKFWKKKSVNSRAKDFVDHSLEKYSFMIIFLRSLYLMFPIYSSKIKTITIDISNIFNETADINS